MKIAIFSDNFYPELSGVADSIIVLARELSTRGHEVAFYVPSYSKKNYEIVKEGILEPLIGDHVSIHRLFSISVPMANGQGRLVIPTFLRWHSLRAFAPDVIHTQLFGGAGLEALAARAFLNIPLIGTNHTAITEFLPSGPGNTEWFKRAGMAYLVWYYNQCDLVTAPSQSILEEMREAGFTKESRAISNPIDTALFHPPTAKEYKEAREHFGLQQPAILYAGRIAPEKHIGVIIEAFALALKKFPKAALMIAGHGSETDALKTLAARRGISDNITFLGTLSKPLLAKLYQASDIFVLTSTSETQSITLMQAMATGLPCVGVNARALPEYIIDGKTGFIVEPGDHHSLVEKMIILLNKDTLRATMGKKGFLTIKKSSPSYIADQWELMYKKAAKK